MTKWLCSCGQPWDTGRHRAAMARDVGNSFWRDSPALIVPYRQWIREKLPNGNQGFVCCGDDGFIRGGYDPKDLGDIGYLVAVEWKTRGRKMDRATDRALAGIELGRVRGTLSITLHGGNAPGALSHYPVAREIAEGDWLPQQPEIADRIVINDNWTRLNETVTEQQLIEALKNAVGFGTAHCPGSGDFPKSINKHPPQWHGSCRVCGQEVPLVTPPDAGPGGVLDDHQADL